MKLFLKAMLCLPVLCAGLFAQSANTAQIAGTVQDASGASIQGAAVKATQTDTGATRTAETGADGSYTLPSLPIGPYRLEVTRAGFSTYIRNGIVLQVASNPTIDAKLQVGNVSQQVEVEASAAMVETRSSGVGQVVDQQRVVDLPLNGRTATDLIYLAGAATTAPNADLVSSKNYPGEAVLSIGGGLATGTTYLLDGGTHNDPFNNLNLPLPFPDALQEFKVETSALPAQYGQHSGGAVNAVTKSGGNNIHGDAFEFVRNYDFNSRNPAAAVRDSLKRNQFGGTIGGPIRKDKLFFFMGYQGNIIRSNPTATFGFIPTPAMLTGDFSTIAGPGCNAGKQINLKNPVTGALYANNQIPVSQFSAPALKMMTFYPKPSDGCGTSFYGTVANQNEHMGIARGDYQINNKQSVFLRYFATHSLQPPTYDGKNPLSMTLSGADDLVNSGVFGHTYVLNANMVNTFRATVNRAGITKIEVPTFDATTLGINMNTLVPGHILISATGAIYSAINTSYAAKDPTTDYQLADDFSFIKGDHQFAFGGNWIRSIQNVYGPLNGDGNFAFNGTATGLSMADFLIGYASTFTQGGIQYDDERYHYIGLYAQDTWKLTSHFSINYGVRWEPYIGGQMSTGYVAHFDQGLFNQNVHSTIYPNAPAGIEFPGDAGFNTNRRPSNTKLNDFAPRIGVVWDPKGDGRMTIRASFGKFYDLPHTLFAYGFSQAPPWGESISRTNVQLSDPWAAGGPGQNNPNAFPGGNPFPINLNKNFVFPIPGNYATYPLQIQPTYLLQRNISLQKQIGANWLISASYLGNNTVHLWADNPINAPVFIPGNCVAGQYGLSAAGACSTTANQNFRRPLYIQNPAQGQYYGTIHQLDTGSTASYNGLLLSAQHRLASHFTVLGNYTWSHCIAGAFTSELDGTQYTNPNNRSFDRGNCGGIDRRTLINLSAVEEAPHFSNRLVQAIAGDWKVSEIVRVQSGGYFSVTTASDQALNSIGGQRAAVVGDPAPGTRTFAQWINPAAFAQPALGTFGGGINNQRGPGTFVMNVALTRELRIRERHRVEFRGEAFNLLNHVQPTNPGASISTLTTFGKVTAFGDPRIMQFALKYMF